MNDMTLQLQSDASLGFGGAKSPILSSYQGLSGNQLIGLADAQSMYNPTPSIGNQQQAMQYVQAAAQATDPQLAQQLLEKAIAMLQGDGSDPQSQPVSTPISTLMAPSTINTTSADPTGSDPGLTVSGNSVNTGEYTITAGTNDDGSLTITNNQTGQSTEVWGDPHIKVNGQDTAEFQKDDLNIQLQDGTVIHIDPTATNSNGVAHIAQVSITKGDQAVTMGGTGTNGFEDGVTTSGVMNNDASFQSGLYNTPTATDITLGADGNLYPTMPMAAWARKSPPSPAAGKPTSMVSAVVWWVIRQQRLPIHDFLTSMQQTMNQLLGMLAQNQDSFYSIMMMQTLSSMMSQSGS